MNFMQRCTKCGQDWWDSHVCPVNIPHPYNTPHRVAAWGTSPITEEDVRRIVREELEKLNHENN